MEPQQPPNPAPSPTPSSRTPPSAARRPGRIAATGRLMVVALIVLAVTATAGVALYRHRAKIHFASTLRGTPEERVLAFTGLLQQNQLRQAARIYGHLPADAAALRACGVPYARTVVSEEETIQFAWGGDTRVHPRDPLAARTGLVFAVTSDGTILYTVEGAGLLQAGGPERPTALIYYVEGEAVRLFVGGRELRPALRAEGGLNVETDAGLRRLSATASAVAAGTLPVLRFDPEADCFQLLPAEASGGEATGSVDAEASPLYCP